MLFNLYVNEVLFHTTQSCSEAFRWFDDWTNQGTNVRLSFVSLV
jgi:hypothetical protein